MALMLQDRRAPEPEPVRAETPADGIAASAAMTPTIAERTFSMVSDLVTDHISGRQKNASPDGKSATDDDTADKLTKLEALRIQGILTDEDFAAKKAELLGRM